MLPGQPLSGFIRTLALAPPPSPPQTERSCWCLRACEVLTVSGQGHRGLQKKRKEELFLNLEPFCLLNSSCPAPPTSEGCERQQTREAASACTTCSRRVHDLRQRRARPTANTCTTCRGCSPVAGLISSRERYTLARGLNAIWLAGDKRGAPMEALSCLLYSSLHPTFPPVQEKDA